MSTMVDNYLPPQEYGQSIPHRKPLPQAAVNNVARAQSSLPFPSLAPVDQHLAHQQHQLLPSHTRTRTSSSSIFPAPAGPAGIATTTMTSSATAYSLTTGNNTRRTLSNATTSTTSSSGHHQHPGVPGALHRTPSSRSGSSTALSYVALMRKQKATVWCERAQHEDARLLAAQRAARKRAQLEFAGGPLGAAQRTSTGSSGMNTSVRSKIRHHGVPKATPYAPANMAGSGVPLRLSATEVDDEVLSDDDAAAWTSGPGYNHRRTGSGRSSLGSATGLRGSYAGVPRIHSAGSTPPSQQGDNSPAMRSEDNLDNLEEETPVPRYGRPSIDYFDPPRRHNSGSTGSRSSGERENSFGDLKQLPENAYADPTSNTATYNQEQSRKKNDELRRRGSVDDRTMTMSGNVRLFVANPDLD